MNKEQGEYYAAKLKYDSFLNGVNSLMNEIDSYHEQIKKNQLNQEQIKLLENQLLE